MWIWLWTICWVVMMRATMTVTDAILTCLVICRRYFTLTYYHCYFSMWAPEHCRISPRHFLAKCSKRQLNQGSFVLLYFSLFVFYVVFSFCIFCIFNLSIILLYFPDHPMWMALYCLIVLMCREESTHSCHVIIPRQSLTIMWSGCLFV